MRFNNFQFQINLPKGADLKARNITPRFSAALLFLPGIILLGMAVLIFLAPRLVLALAAGLFLYFGLIFCVLGWKFMKLRKRFKEMMAQMNDQAEVETFPISNAANDTSFQSELHDTKKIILH